jgi:uncharacterized protein
MPLDLALLAAHRSFTDPRAGITERFVDLDLGGSRTFGVLAEPAGPPRVPAWVLCHSFGNEQVDLSTTETALARRLAAEGFPVLRFHARGYGDAEDLDTTPGLGTQLEDALAAVEYLRSEEGASSVGTVGARFGGAVAALAAQREGLDHMALIAPVTAGRRYVAELMRFQLVGELTGGIQVTTEGMRSTLAAEGQINLNGWILRRDVSDELERLDLAGELSSFRGRALVVQVSSRQREVPALRALVEHLRGLGVQADLATVVDRTASHFGYEHFQAVSPTEIVDTSEALNYALTDTVARWAVRP